MVQLKIFFICLERAVMIINSVLGENLEWVTLAIPATCDGVWVVHVRAPCMDGIQVRTFVCFHPTFVTTFHKFLTSDGFSKLSVLCQTTFTL